MHRIPKTAIALLLAVLLSFGAVPALTSGLTARAAQIESGPTRDVRDYTYEITPILAPFPYYIYVKTNNPDPESFMLVDKSSKYFTADDHGQISSLPDENGTYYSSYTDPGTYYCAEMLFPDAAYEDTTTYRVNGGYIFKFDGAVPDGGELVLKERTSQGSSILNNTYQETEVTIPCPDMKTNIDYLIDTYTDPSNTFFENLDAVQAGLNSIAIYPRDVLDSSRPNTARPYPLLSTSPYYELSLNEHYDAMFAKLSYKILLYKAYPFVLDSYGVPGAMRSVALSLEPEATVAAGSTHAFVNITFNGETHSYGGAGRGGYDPLFTEYVDVTFTFDGSEGDFAASPSIDLFGSKADEYASIAAEVIAPYRDLISGSTFKSTVAATGGTWARVATEGGFSFGTTFTYLVPRGSGVEIASQVWIDGRYIDVNERICLGVPLDQYTTAGILLHDITFTDYYGAEHTQDVIYRYNSGSDQWEAWYYYTGGGWYSGNMTLPDELILTRAEVEAIKAAQTEGSRLPESGLIYDGTAYPGTPFTNVLVEGLDAPDTFTAIVGRSYSLPVTVLPENATYPQLSMVSSDSSVVSCGSSNYFYAVAPGTATVTIMTNDGRFTKDCVITVEKDYALNEALNVEGGRLEFATTGSIPFEVSEEDERLVAKLTGKCDIYSNSIQTTVELYEGDIIQYECKLGGSSYYNRLNMYLDYTQVAVSYGYTSNWQTVSYTVTQSGQTTLRWRFDGYSDASYCMIDNIRIIRANPVTYSVNFVDWDGTPLSSQEVEEGSAAIAPEDPVREGYVFIGWDTQFDCVMSDLTVTALYEPAQPPVNEHLGDVNNDGTIDFSDASALAAYLMGVGTPDGVANADANSDGSVTIADITAIYAIIFG